MDRKTLLGLSGGPDSLALFFYLLEKGDPFGVAHVDHGWREESRDEAKELQALAEEYKIPFHLKRLDAIKGNLENESRNERLKFFKEVCQQFGYEGVILGHHADDQAETVCKRIFEGAPLTKLGAMEEVTHLDGLVVLRPFLKFRKKELQKWLKKAPFFDSTNSDPRFLRARMREKLLPDLSQTFGKEIAPSLSAIGEEAKRLKDYLDRKIAPYLNKVESGVLGRYLEVFPEEEVEIRHLIRTLIPSLSRSLLETIIDKLREKKGNICISKGEIYVDRGRLFLLSANKVQWVEKPVDSGGNKVGWKEVWKGEVVVTLPPGEYHIREAVNKAPYPGSNPIDKWWTAKKIPAFLRSMVPVVWKGEKIFFEFLNSDPSPLERGVKIALSCKVL